MHRRSHFLWISPRRLCQSGPSRGAVRSAVVLPPFPHYVRVMSLANQLAPLLLAPVSDRAFTTVQFLYRYRTWPRLEQPVTLNEKIQWIKLNNRDPLLTRCVDKYEVRDYIAERVDPAVLIPLLGVYERADEVPFDALPDRFVLKATHGSGWNLICTAVGKCSSFHTWPCPMCRSARSTMAIATWPSGAKRLTCQWRVSSHNNPVILSPKGAKNLYVKEQRPLRYFPLRGLQGRLFAAVRLTPCPPQSGGGALGGVT